MMCDRCGETPLPASPAFGCVLCADCRSWLKTIALLAIQAERASWAKPEALTDAVLEAIAAAQTADRNALKARALERKLKGFQRTGDMDAPRYQRR